jgi:dolichyl-phosphate beta-glucosyltransferase
LPDGSRSEPKALPCWLDKWDAEEERLEGMLEEAVEFLESEYGAAHDGEKGTGKEKGWEILVVSDGSKDGTVDKALEFAKEHQLSQHPMPKPGPWSKNGGAKTQHSTHIPHGSIRVITLEENRGKGGAVTHGMRHVRGQYIVFADADGASRFDDLGKMVEGCRKVEDKHGRGVAIGSRAHLVGSEAVVKVCSQDHPPVCDFFLTDASAQNSATSSCTPSTSFFAS